MIAATSYSCATRVSLNRGHEDITFGLPCERRSAWEPHAMRFFSDNAAAAHPAVMDAIAASNRLDTAYDGDEWSGKLDAAFSDLFETEVRALWVTTGTAANCLALAALCPPYGGIVCHRDAHIEVDEAGAPGFFTHGAKLILVDGAGAKVTPRRGERSGRPHPQRRPPGPGPRLCRSPTRPNMASSYSRRRSRRARRAGRARKLGFHMDGARFANAIVATGASPADLTWRAGVDALSFGFVKNGGLNAEALILFRTELRRRNPRPPQARRPSAVERPVPRRADPRDARRTTCGSPTRAPPTPPRKPSPRPRPTA